MLKRSSAIKLTLLTTSMLTLTACGEQQTEAELLTNPNDCETSSLLTPGECLESYEEAKEEHVKSAPRYEDENLCESEFGNNQCEFVQDRNGGGSFWMPFFAGWMVSSALDNIGDNNKYKKRYHYTPVYSRMKNGTGIFTTLRGDTVRTKGGKFYVPSSSMSYKPKPATIMTKSTIAKSGGFGASRTSGFGRSGGFGG